MRALLAIGGILAIVLGHVHGAVAQSALRDAQPPADAIHAIHARGAFTLRPEPGLREIAAEVASVLELRTGAHVEVGEPPPPGLAEAVPAGHVAIVRTPEGVHLVLGATGGRSLSVHVELPDGLDAGDARALALAVESLHDTALDGHYAGGDGSSVQVPHDPGVAHVAADASADGSGDSLSEVSAWAARARALRDARSDEGSEPGDFWQPHFLRDVQLLAFARVYSGASAQSSSVESGLGGGLGLCAIGQCLLLSADLPVSDAATSDLRYRYSTYAVAFYSRPEALTFGDFTPGGRVGLLTRVGHFRDDMGLSDGGLDTDLAARGSVELGYLAHRNVDVLLEAGVDYLLDRYLLSDRGGAVERGERVTPWLQAAVRVRPY